MIRRRRRETFIFAFILTMRAASVPSPSLYEIQAYKFGGAFHQPTAAAAGADSSPPTPSEQDPEVNLEFDSLEATVAEMAATIEETERKTTNTRPPLKVLRQSSSAAAASASATVEPTLTEDAAPYYKDLKKGGGADPEAAAAAAAPVVPLVRGQKPVPSPRRHHHYADGPIEDEFLPVADGTIDLEHLEPTAGATAVSREEEADADEGDIGESSGWNSGTTNSASTRVPATSPDYYYKPYYTTASGSDSASATHYVEEEGYYYKPFSTQTTSLSNTLQYEQIFSTTPTTTAATTTTTATPKPTLLQKILDGEFNFFNDPVANWITFFTAAGVFFQFFATPFGRVTTGRRRRRKRRVERNHYHEFASPELGCLIQFDDLPKYFELVGRTNYHRGLSLVSQSVSLCPVPRSRACRPLIHKQELRI